VALSAASGRRRKGRVVVRHVDLDAHVDAVAGEDVAVEEGSRVGSDGSGDGVAGEEVVGEQDDRSGDGDGSVGKANIRQGSDDGGRGGDGGKGGDNGREGGGGGIGDGDGGGDGKIMEMDAARVVLVAEGGATGIEIQRRPLTATDHPPYQLPQCLLSGKSMATTPSAGAEAGAEALRSVSSVVSPDAMKRAAAIAEPPMTRQEYLRNPERQERIAKLNGRGRGGGVSNGDNRPRHPPDP